MLIVAGICNFHDCFLALVCGYISYDFVGSTEGEDILGFDQATIVFISILDSFISIPCMKRPYVESCVCFVFSP